MPDTSNVGSAEPAGLPSTPALERLRPFQIATRTLPTAPVTVLKATDAQFQAFVTDWCELDIPEDEQGWSFDDRIRLINYARKLGIDLFVNPPRINSDETYKQFENNSQTIPGAQLFEVAQEAPQDTLDAIGVSTVPELRDDIDSLLDEIKNSSDSEQKEFGAGQ